MRHPKEYTTVPFNGVHVMAVDAGTVITDEKSGESITVQDDVCARKGPVIFCTQKVFDEWKRKEKGVEDA